MTPISCNYAGLTPPGGSRFDFWALKWTHCAPFLAPGADERRPILKSIVSSCYSLAPPWASPSARFAPAWSSNASYHRPWRYLERLTTSRSALDSCRLFQRVVLLGHCYRLTSFWLVSSKMSFLHPSYVFSIKQCTVQSRGCNSCSLPLWSTG